MCCHVTLPNAKRTEGQTPSTGRFISAPLEYAASGAASRSSAVDVVALYGDEVGRGDGPHLEASVCQQPVDQRD